MKTWDEGQKSYRAAAVAAALVLLGLVAWLDYLTGVEIAFSIFYLAPVALVAWNAGLVLGLTMSFVCAAVWLLMDYKLGDHPYSSQYIAYWNSLVRLGFFAATSASLSLIRKLLRREQDSSRLKSEMVSLISHEFNNSLTTVDLVSTLLREADGDPIPQDRLKLYGILTQTSRNLKQFVKNFLNRARLESGRLQFEFQPTELRRIILQVTDTLRPLCEEKGVSIQTDFPTEVIPVKVDPDAIALAMSNLIGNAVKYTPRNGLVGISITPQDAPEGQVTVSVRDTGIGIEEKDLQAIFSGFFRAEGGKAAAKGFGIGLKVTSDLIRAHGSSLRVKSSPGLGSIFSFTLPIWKEKR